MFPQINGETMETETDFICDHRNMRPLPARVSSEVPRSILKFEMLLGTLDATPKVPNIPVSLQGITQLDEGPETP